MKTADILSRHRWTPVNPDYPSCERVYAALLVYPDSLSAENVSDILECVPTEAVNRGDIRHTSGKVYPHTFWLLSSENVVESMDLRDHIDWLLSTVSLDETKSLKLASDEGLRLTVKCIWWSRSGTGGPTLWPEQMNALASLGLECTFDVSFFGDGD